MSEPDSYTKWSQMMAEQRHTACLLTEEMGCLNTTGKIELEVERAQSKFPEWPDDPIHAAMIMAEEAGEVFKDVLQLTYEPHKTTKEKLGNEVIQLAAMCHRFLMSMDKYDFKPSTQHKQ